MAARTGMGTMVMRLREHTFQGSVAYTINGTSYWTDDQLQDVLDRNIFELRGMPLYSEAEWLDGTFQYLRYCAAAGNLEEATSGTSYWRIQDTDYVTVGTSNYTADYDRGIVEFTSDQQGELYYIYARSYDLNAAAADVWEKVASSVWQAYDISADGQSMSRDQMYQHAKEKAAEYRRMTGAKIARFRRSDLF